MKWSLLLKGKMDIIIPVLIFLLPGNILSGQQEYSYYYRVYLNDKGANSVNEVNLSDLVSERAVNRRTKSGIVVPDYTDLPVFREYTDQISALGFDLFCTSRWMNTALFRTKTEKDTAPLLSLPFVSAVKIVRKPSGKSQYSNKLDVETSPAGPLAYDRPVSMINGHPLHNSGYNGTGVLIAVLDGGFMYANEAISLAGLRSRHGIRHTYDFVNKSRFVYAYNTHGTSVLSVIAGNIPGGILGTAPAADFLLLRTEDGMTEFPVEEDFWAAGAEFADSAGADIISSSLGYFNFDDPEMNYEFADLDGNTAFVTRAADIAASKGILVVNSAGNERDNAWRRIIAPADGDSVLAAGAVDGNNLISYFSSAGPSADGRIKPDISGMGVNVVIQRSATQLGRANGTSFSCPVISGMAAALMEAVPEATAAEILNVFQLSADRYSSPDSLYGYGIPDMVKALNLLQDKYVTIPDKNVIAWPNPTSGEVEFVFSKPPEKLIVEIVNSAGTMFFKKDFGEYAGRNLIVTALNNREQGLYLVRFRTGNGTFTSRIIKLRDRK